MGFRVKELMIKVATVNEAVGNEEEKCTYNTAEKDPGSPEAPPYGPLFLLRAQLRQAHRGFAAHRP